MLQRRAAAGRRAVTQGRGGRCRGGWRERPQKWQALFCGTPNTGRLLVFHWARAQCCGACFGGSETVVKMGDRGPRAGLVARTPPNAGRQVPPTPPEFRRGWPLSAPGTAGPGGKGALAPQQCHGASEAVGHRACGEAARQSAVSRGALQCRKGGCWPSDSPSVRPVKAVTEGLSANIRPSYIET